MITTSIIQSIKSKVEGITIPREIVAIYLYGSILKGKIRMDSDIDISILTLHNIDGHERLQLISKTEAIFTSLFKAIGLKRQVSVLDMRSRYVSLQLIYRVITEGMLVYESDSSIRREFENAIKRDYFDFRPYLMQLMEKKYGCLPQKT